MRRESNLSDALYKNLKVCLCVYIADMFLELCAFLRGAGHLEKAIALFQAQIEFNLFRPSILSRDMSHSDAVDFMSVYWDSSAPKFGENSSVGWSSWVENGGVYNTSGFWYSKGRRSHVGFENKISELKVREIFLFCNQDESYVKNILKYAEFPVSLSV